MNVTGRMAPTPSGQLHLGNVLAFAAAWLSAKSQGGQVLLRIEDIDRGRSRSEVAHGQRRDLAWLGLVWDREVTPQSQRAYSLDGIPTFRCVCTRATRLYLGCRCRYKEHDRGAWRFDTPRGVVRFCDRVFGEQEFEPEEDPILMRADGEPAYPLAVVLDDLADGVTEVVRGGDLLEATATQVRLYEVLGRATPTWLHVPVLVGSDGKKLSKSHGSTEVISLREAGYTASDIWRVLLPILGVEGDVLSAATFDPSRIVPVPSLSVPMPVRPG